MFSIKTCRVLSGVDSVFPFYHAVSDVAPSHISPLYKLRSVDQFKEDLNVLQSHFTFVDAKTLKEHISHNKKGNVALLSFDDGLKQCYDIIWPILKEKSIPAVFFVNKNFTKGDDIFYRYKVGMLISSFEDKSEAWESREEIESYLKDEKRFVKSIGSTLLGMNFADEKYINEVLRLSGLSIRNRSIYMNENEVKEISKNGFNIGGHGLDHSEFWALDDNEKLMQVKESVDYCQEEFDEKMRLFAFPFYDYNLNLSIFRSMYDELEIDLSFGTSGMKSDVFSKNLQRLDMEMNHKDIRSFLKQEYSLQAIRRLIGKNQIKRSK